VPWFQYIWSEEAVEHLAEHGISQDDFEFVMEHPISKTTSDSSGRPLVFGYTSDGRHIAAIFELLDDGITVVPVTCYEVPE
jgi:uncharacterized DUF497 family protein